MKDLWEMSVEELDEQIQITEQILKEGGYNKLAHDRLASLMFQREERLIEQQILERSKYAKDVLQAVEKPVSD